MLDIGWKIMEHVRNVEGSVIIVELRVCVCSVMLGILWIVKEIAQHVALLVLPATLAAQTVLNAKQATLYPLAHANHAKSKKTSTVHNAHLIVYIVLPIHNYAQLVSQALLCYLMAFVSLRSYNTDFRLFGMRLWSKLRNVLAWTQLKFKWFM